MLAALLAVAGCSRTPPEAAVRAQVAALQAAIEARDASAIAELLADDFIGNDGVDRDGARRMAALLFLRASDVGVTCVPLDVTIRSGDTASATCTAAVTGGAGLLPDSAQAYAVDSSWRLDGDDWKLTSLRWTPRL